MQAKETEINTSLPKPGGTETPFPRELRATLRQGRWLLVASETAVTLFVLTQTPTTTPVRLTLLALAVYNLFSILAVGRAAMPRFLVPLMLGLDLVFILLAARLTGGVQSPFMGQYYLIILAAALLYDLPGGILVAVAACGAALAAQYPSYPLYPLQIHVLGNLIPSYLLAGGFTGFLVRNLKAYYVRDVAARLREKTAAHELQLAHDMQEASLPAQPPDIPGLETAFLTRFAGEVGGDFLLFLAPEVSATPKSADETRLGLLIGDVSGKGIAAALAATGIAHLLPWLHPLDNPARALHDLNDDLNERLPAESYATALFVEVGADNLRLWTAGHPPALLWRAADERIVTVDAIADPPLGLFPTWSGTAETLPWAIGDVLLLYTDGASETRDSQGEQFGAERIGAILSTCVRAPAPSIVQTIYAAVEKWGTPIDDLTLVVCKRVAVPVSVPASLPSTPSTNFRSATLKTRISNLAYQTPIEFAAQWAAKEQGNQENVARTKETIEPTDGG